LAVASTPPDSGTPRYSVVIPAYNEEQLLPRLLDSIDAARRIYGGVNRIEVIVADNGSTDRTAAIAAARGCQVVTVDKRVIAAVRNGGARVARGDIIAFVDADTQIHPRTFIEIDSALATGRVIGGATGATLERWSPGILLVYLTLVPIALFAGIDTGVVFCQREDFVAVSGYDEERLVAEDIAFLLALKRLGKARGQRLARVTRAKVIVSTRKFDEFGDWHYFALIAEGLRHLMRRAPTEFTDRYWYKPRR
jgi:glycosyltransferase involved in cell wall biosynthesis